MLKRHLWKILLSLALAAWGLSELLPLQDVPFVTYAREHATPAKAAEFGKLMDEAVAVAKAGKAAFDEDSKAGRPTKPPIVEATVLRQIASDRKIDLAAYYPDILLEASLTNIQKKNNIIITELLRRARAHLQQGLDLKGGVSFTLKVDPKALDKIANDSDRALKITKAVDILSSRINRMGVAEPIVRPVGKDRIEVQLPAVNTKENPEIVNEVKRPAVLSFRKVYNVRPSPGMDAPAGYDLMTEDDERGGKTYTEEYYVKRTPEMTGEMISNSYVRRDAMTRKPGIDMDFTKEGRVRFAEVTKEIAADGQRTGTTGLLAIVLDDTLYSAPTVKAEIDSPSASITGSFTDREAFNLANVLNNPLDLPLTVDEQYEVGPSLAADAVASGKRAAIIGTAAVAAFMITFYTTGGVVSVITLAVNILIILGTMASFGATMTLPGLAGIVLTIGMAVDANILIYERMREELAAGKTLATSNQSGYMKALTTILDAHIVQLIICGIMIWLGKGPIRGFGVTLAIGVISTLFSVLLTAHLIMEMLIEAGWLKKFTMRRILKSIHVDFIKYGKPAFIASWAVVIIGIGVVFYKGHAIYGTDFAGGDVITIAYKTKPDAARIRQIATQEKIGEISPTFTSPIGGGAEKLRIETPENKSDALFAALKAAYPAAGLEAEGTSHIGASIGKEIELNALLAVGVSMLTILVYIAFRFEFGFGVGAMFSSLHDILMTIGVFVIFGHQFSAPMVAAILCIAGYSINETVVVFDRIREELKLNPTGSLRDVVNSAINKVFARTIMTSTTTFLAALSLFVFGGGVLEDISFTFLVGIVTSTFSAIFIAAQVFYWWHKGDRKHVEAHSDVAPKYEWQGSSKASH